MNKKLIAGLAVFAFLLSGSMALAGNKNAEQKANQEGYTHRVIHGSQHINLYQKDSSDWSIIENDVWGRLNYSPQDEEAGFVFNGHGLEVGTEYTLLSYKEPWRGCGSVILGEATANEEGNVHIMGEMKYVINDYPYGFGGDYEGVSGAKIWLVPSADFNGTCFTGWHPNEYLFEDELIYKTPYNYTLLNLVMKNPSDWSIVPGSYGIVHYNENDYKFWGYGLNADINYTLLSYDEPWPGLGSKYLGNGQTDGSGYVYFEGVSEFIYNSYDSGEYAGSTGAKIWLVPSNRVFFDGNNEATSFSWAPAEFLFETELILQ